MSICPPPTDVNSSSLAIPSRKTISPCFFAVVKKTPRIREVGLKAKRKALPKHILVKDLPQDDTFHQLRVDKKHFVDTIKLIAYRAETATSHILREKINRKDDARSLLRHLYRSEADLIPDHSHNTLTVHLHHLINNAHDQAIAHLCDELTATETCFPGSNLRLIYRSGGSS